jgi:hypothetical protein
MSSKDAISKTAGAPASRRTEPAYDLFDSLRRARSKKELRQKPQSPANDQPQDTGRRDDE